MPECRKMKVEAILTRASSSSWRWRDTPSTHKYPTKDPIDWTNLKIANEDAEVSLLAAKLMIVWKMKMRINMFKFVFLTCKLNVASEKPRGKAMTMGTSFSEKVLSSPETSTAYKAYQCCYHFQNSLIFLINFAGKINSKKDQKRNYKSKQSEELSGSASPLPGKKAQHDTTKDLSTWSADTCYKDKLSRIITKPG